MTIRDDLIKGGVIILQRNDEEIQEEKKMTELSQAEIKPGSFQLQREKEQRQKRELEQYEKDRREWEEKIRKWDEERGKRDKVKKKAKEKRRKREEEKRKLEEDKIKQQEKRKEWEAARAEREIKNQKLVQEYLALKETYEKNKDGIERQNKARDRKGVEIKKSRSQLKKIEGVLRENHSLMSRINGTGKVKSKGVVNEIRSIMSQNKSLSKKMIALKYQNLKKESFLKKAGYSIALGDKQRKKLLNDVIVPQYGLRKTAGMIEFNIDNHSANEEQKQKYSRALSIWSKDLNMLLEKYENEY